MSDIAASNSTQTSAIDHQTPASGGTTTVRSAPSKKRTAAEVEQDELVEQRTAYVTETVGKIRGIVNRVHATKRARVKRLLDSLTSINTQLNQLYDRKTGELEPAEKHLIGTQLHGFDALFPVDKVAHTVKRRNRGTFPVGGWSSDSADAAEIEKFAERDAKVVARYKQQMRVRDKASEKIIAAGISSELAATEEERQEFERLRSAIQANLSGWGLLLPRQETDIDLRIARHPRDFQ